MGSPGGDRKPGLGCAGADFLFTPESQTVTVTQKSHLCSAKLNERILTDRGIRVQSCPLAHTPNTEPKRAENGQGYSFSTRPAGDKVKEREPAWGERGLRFSRLGGRWGGSARRPEEAWEGVCYCEQWREKTGLRKTERRQEGSSCQHKASR